MNHEAVAVGKDFKRGERTRAVADIRLVQHSPTMLLRRTILFTMLWVALTDGATAQQASDRPPKTHLRGLSSAEADALIKNLQDLQGKLRHGEEVFFELLSGAPASYPMTEVSPREAFLQIPFDKAFIIQRVQTDNRLWQPFKLVFTPNGPGQLIWDIEVVLGFYGQVERVEMVYKPPAPF